MFMCPQTCNLQDIVLGMIYNKIALSYELSFNMEKFK